MIANVSHISQYGISLLLSDREMFRSYKGLPLVQGRICVRSLECPVTSTTPSLLAGS